MDVRVDGHHQVGRGDRPKPEIDPVGGTDHPAQVEEKALARASRAGIAHEVPSASIGSVTAKSIGEPTEPLSEVSIGATPLDYERFAEGPVLVEHPARMVEHRRQMPAPVDAVDEAVERTLELRPSLVRRGPCGTRAEHAERAIDALTRGDRVAEREARSDETRDFLVARVFIPMDEVDGIAVSRRRRVARLQQGIEALADCVHVARVLAILPSAPQ